MDGWKGGKKGRREGKWKGRERNLSPTTPTPGGLSLGRQFKQVS